MEASKALVTTHTTVDHREPPAKATPLSAAFSHRSHSLASLPEVVSAWLPVSEQSVCYML